LALFQDFKRFKHPEGAKTLASLMLLGLNRLPWPSPDVIIPFLKNQASFILGKALAKMLSCPFYPMLHPVHDGVSYHPKAKKKEITDLKVLIIVGQLESSEILRKCRFALRPFFPKSIYSLALIENRNTIIF
jgi:hypothetical protein